MNIALGCDHAGFHLKNIIINYLKTTDRSPKDFGVFSEESSDYSDQAVLVSNAVLSGEFEYGILICGTGIGMSVAANKHKGIRAALCSETFSACCARQHNNANILTMGSRTIGPGLAVAIVEDFLSTSFEGGRHIRRLDKIKFIEE
jgi:ribose 5-phosphate isomerase B